jgi:hypothetical protein
MLINLIVLKLQASEPISIYSLASMHTTRKKLSEIELAKKDKRSS